MDIEISGFAMFIDFECRRHLWQRTNHTETMQGKGAVKDGSQTFNSKINQSEYSAALLLEK